jgi:hypothetical protein
MIKILDGFFEEDDLSKIQEHVTTKISYTPCWSDGQEKTKKSYYGDRFYLNGEPKLRDFFVRQVENKFKIKIKELDGNSGIDLRNLDDFKPHIDKFSKINILIMLYGPVAVTNGTVFYTKDKLDIHVGFRPNRAVLFPSNWTHSSHASKEKGTRRYTSSIFVNDYENVLE